MVKKVALVVAGSGEIRDLSVEPGTTVGDVLERMRLGGYLVSAGPDEPFLRLSDDIHRAAPEGGRLYASTPAEAGAEGFSPERE